MAKNRASKKDLLDLLNRSAVYSAASGKPVTFVEEITAAERMDPQGIYCDLSCIIDNAENSEDDLSGMFAVTQEGEAEGFDELFARFGDWNRHPDSVFRNAKSVLALREDVVVSPAEEGDEEEESIDIYTNEGCDVYAGIAVKAEDIAPAEVFTELIRKCGIAVRDSMIEFMATVFPAEGEDEADHLLELFYRISGGDAWFRAYSVGIKKEETDIDELFPELLQDIASEINWDRILESAPEAELPTIGSREGNKVLRPFRRK